MSLTLPLPPAPATFDTLTVTRPSPHVVLVTLNRPHAANALNTQMATDLIGLFERFQVAADDVRAIVLTGAGDSAFCAGGDLKERRGMDDATWATQHAVFERMVRALVACPIPLIAAVNGAAYGGGCEIALTCDFVYAAPTARFAFTEVTLGIIPGAGGTQTLARAAGTRRAKELILTGAPFDAEEARAFGIVNKMCEPGAVLADTLATAKVIAQNAPIATRQAKQAIDRGVDMALGDGLAFEIEAYSRTVPTEDRREGVNAFNEKRAPVFKGR